MWSKSKPQSGSDILSTHFHFVPWRSFISHSCQTVLLGGFQAMSAKMADVEIFCINHFHFTFTLNLKKNSKWYTLYFLPILMPAKMTDVKFHRPFIFYVWHKGGLGGISSEILLGQWHPAGATPHHAKPILCLWLEIRALHQVLLTSMQHGFQSRPPVKNGLDAVCTDVVRWLHTSDLGLQSCG